MLDLQQLQILLQLIENIEISADRLERAYGNNDAEVFRRSKDEIFDIQNKISINSE